MEQLKFSEEHAAMHELSSNNANLVDQRIKHFLSFEMKKVSQMLIQNLTVFVQHATKL